MVAALAVLFSASYAQTMEESVEARNKGAELMANGDINGAIAALEKCVEISKNVGEEADENRIVAEAALPGLYLQKADKVLSTRDYEAALKAFEEVLAVAEKYKNDAVKEKVEKPMTEVYYVIGATAFQKNDIAAALENLDIAITRDPDHAKSYYIKGVVYQKQGDEDKMAENYKSAIEKADAGNDRNTSKNAKSALSKYYYNKGIGALQKKSYDDAVAAFNQATEVDDAFADAYFRMATCYNAKKDYDKAIVNAEKALSLKTAEKDGIYFELGNAYMAKKDNANACEAFKQVQADPYAANAKHQREVVLKCK
jgi:tetratricopeptide (TPR) repeat protein